MTHNTALIFGITGQDGSYLAEQLLSKGYDVHGVVRRTSTGNRQRLAPVIDAITLHDGDLADSGSIWRIMADIRPDEIYNLAAQPQVHTSFAEPEHTGGINALGPVRILDAMRVVAPRAKFYQASTSELFGQGNDRDGAAFNEDSAMLPASPYGAAKLYAFHMVRIYRQAYGLFACNGILFNHESPRRAGDFVTSKIASFVRTLRGGAWDGEPLRLGNVDARRDWGHARDYADGMWRMLQTQTPRDYVLATGVTHSVRDFVDAALPGLAWSGAGVDTVARDRQRRVMVVIDPALYRPIDVACLRGDATRARNDLGWTPLTSFAGLVAEMIEGEPPAQAGGRARVAAV